MSAGPGRSTSAPCPGRSSATHSYSGRRATSGSQARALSPDPCTNTSVRVLRGIAPSPLASLAPLAPFVIALLSRNGLLSPEQPLSPFLRRPHAVACSLRLKPELLSSSRQPLPPLPDGPARPVKYSAPRFRRGPSPAHR